MKRSIQKTLKGWRIGDFLRQFAIVAGGVLLTLWLTGRITDAAKQREVRQAMQLVTLELRDNLQTVRTYENIYNEEKRIALHLLAENFSAAALPADTANYYSQKILNGLARPFHFSTDALEMLKTSGLASHIADKQQMLDVLHSYTALEEFDSMMELYFNMRKEVLTTNYTAQTLFDQQQGIARHDLGQAIENPQIKRWLYTLPRGFNTGFFPNYEQQLEEIIAQLEATYQ